VLLKWRVLPTALYKLSKSHHIIPDLYIVSEVTSVVYILFNFILLFLFQTFHVISFTCNIALHVIQLAAVLCSTCPTHLHVLFYSSQNWLIFATNRDTISCWSFPLSVGESWVTIQTQFWPCYGLLASRHVTQANDCCVVCPYSPGVTV